MHPVQWTRSALNDLADLWADADTERRNAVAEAVHEIDRRLGADPLGEGESRDYGRRILLVPPLALLYGVGPEEVVRVLNVWLYPSR